LLSPNKSFRFENRQASCRREGIVAVSSLSCPSLRLSAIIGANERERHM
jgi:hypothetical protein